VSVRLDKPNAATMNGSVAIDIDGTTIIAAPDVSYKAGWNKLGVVYWKTNGLVSVTLNDVWVHQVIVKPYSDSAVYVGAVHYSANGNTQQHVRNLRAGIIKGGF